MRIGIFGRGRLGSAVARALDTEPDLKLAWALGRDDKPPFPVDVALDASVAEAVPSHVRWAIENGVDLVVGTTGWNASELDGLDFSRTALLVAPNFSLAVAFMRRAAAALGRFAAMDERSELSIIERHHRGKIEAPSGTAKLLAAAIAEGCPRYSGWTQGRAESGRVNIASLRTGDEIGYHEIRYDCPMERLTLSHEAMTRQVFATGAIKALRWIHGKKGRYMFDDLAAELISALYQEAV